MKYSSDQPWSRSPLSMAPTTPTPLLLFVVLLLFVLLLVLLLALVRSIRPIRCLYGGQRVESE